MKAAIIISLILITVIGLFLFLALSDSGGQNNCTIPLTDCVKTCNKNDFMKDSTCVLDCSFGNVACLASSLWTD